MVDGCGTIVAGCQLRATVIEQLFPPTSERGPLRLQGNPRHRDPLGGNGIDQAFDDLAESACTPDHDFYALCRSLLAVPALAQVRGCRCGWARTRLSNCCPQF